MSHDLFHRLQTAKAQKNYASTLVCLVAFLLCDKKSYKFKVPPDIMRLIAELKALLFPSQLPPLAMTHTWDAHSLKLLELLMTIWTHTWDLCHGGSPSIWDPTMCFIALASIKADHSWAQVVEVTPLLTRLVYCIRTIFLASLHLGNIETVVI